MKILITGLKDSATFVRRIAPSLLAGVADVERHDATGVTLSPSTDLQRLARHDAEAWLLPLMQAALHNSGQELSGVRIAFLDDGAHARSLAPLRLDDAFQA